VEARWGWEAGPEFWALLEGVLAQRHGAAPVHSWAEIQLLASRFPEEIRLVTAWADGVLAAGAVMFCMFPVMHLQYSASSPLGRKVGGTDVVIEAGIAAARAEGYRHYDFGTCSEEEGWALNTSLYEFKLSFGAGSAVFEHYAVVL
jgi:lipid II:glycine glycyltransferase (peptidoglycan interpeptide bridge formation enzyme)